MTVAEFVTLLDAIIRLLGVLVLPVLVLFLLVRYGPRLGAFLSTLTELTLRGAGMEASIRRTHAEAAGALAAAAMTRDGVGSSPQERVRSAQSAAETVSDAVTPEAARRLRGGVVLWVDDRPDGNFFERQSMEAIGLRFVLVETTEDALERTSRESFDLIISDMARGDDRRAGYALLEALRDRGDRTPVVIYAGSASPEQRAEARQRGAVDSTNRPDELFRLAVTAIVARDGAGRP